MIEPKDIIDACIHADNQLDDVFRKLHDLVGTPKVFFDARKFARTACYAERRAGTEVFGRGNDDV